MSAKRQSVENHAQTQNEAFKIDRQTSKHNNNKISYIASRLHKKFLDKSSLRLNWVFLLTYQKETVEKSMCSLSAESPLAKPRPNRGRQLPFQ